MSDYSHQDVMAWLSDLSMGLLDFNDDNMGLAAAALALLQPVPIPDTDQLSPHFTLTELTYSDTANTQHIDNTPDEDAIEQLTLLANKTLEGIRSICGNHPMLISSGYRCPELNAAVGGVSDSAHLYGAAADFTIPTFGTVDDICRTLQAHLVDLEIDQLINELGGGSRWVHVGRAVAPAQPRHQSFSA